MTSGSSYREVREIGIPLYLLTIVTTNSGSSSLVTRLSSGNDRNL